MRRRLPDRIERGRLRLQDGYGGPPGAMFGAFRVMGPCGAELTIVASDGVDAVSEGWEHVSVSARRIPNWLEMAAVKNWFWRDDECVVQFHPPASEHINNYSHCLHLWRHRQLDFPLPPAILVGVKALGTLA